MRHPMMPRPRRTSPATDHAISVLRWMEPRLRSAIEEIEDSAERTRLLRATQRARRRIGTVARARMYPVGPQMPVTGTGDEAHGHTRLVAILDDVIVPMIAVGYLEQGFVRELMQRLRGQFARQYGKLARAVAGHQQAESAEEERPDGLVHDT